MAASKALAEAKADLVVAQKAVETARAELIAAEAADEAAQAELNAAVFAEQRATRDLSAVETRILVRERDLGQLARAAYQTNGAMGEWAIVLASTTPNQLADRIAFLQSVGSAGNSVLAQLREDRADLVNAQSTLTAARKPAGGGPGRRRDRPHRREQQGDDGAGRGDAGEHGRRGPRGGLRGRPEGGAGGPAAVPGDRRRTPVRSAAASSSSLPSWPRVRNRPKGTGEMVRPGTGEVTSSFGPRFHPILKYVKVHTGIDFGAGDGIVYAADDGVVLFTEFNTAYGNMTVVDHGKIGGLRITTLYAHQAAVGVEPGDPVIQGQAIGVVGSTGYSTGPHLHFEVRIDGEPLDPAPVPRERQPAQCPARLQDHPARLNVT